MVDGFSGRYVRYKTGLKPWGSQSGNTIPVVILLSYGFTYLRTKMPRPIQPSRPAGWLQSHVHQRYSLVVTLATSRNNQFIFTVTL